MTDRVDYGGHTDWSSGQPRWVFSHPDGSFYERADPDDFPDLDAADSRAIGEPGRWDPPQEWPC